MNLAHLLEVGQVGPGRRRPAAAGTASQGYAGGGIKEHCSSAKAWSTIRPVVAWTRGLATLPRQLSNCASGSSRLRKVRSRKKSCRMQRNGRSTLPLVFARQALQALGADP